MLCNARPDRVPKVHWLACVSIVHAGYPRPRDGYAIAVSMDARVRNMLWTQVISFCGPVGLWSDIDNMLVPPIPASTVA